MREPPICLNITADESNDLKIISPLGIQTYFTLAFADPKARWILNSESEDEAILPQGIKISVLSTENLNYILIEDISYDEGIGFGKIKLMIDGIES